MYEKLSGMTGTAMTEANEFKEIYKLEVLEIPTHRACQREDFDDEIYMTEREKYNAILKEIKEMHGKGRPILIGTESVEVSEKLSRILKQNKLEHTILNAKNHAKEAEIIADAGKKGAITLATNMAGRGTDIKLKEGVYREGLENRQNGQEGSSDSLAGTRGIARGKTRSEDEKYEVKPTPAGSDFSITSGIKECGGLHVIGTTRHQSRRIDRQLRGRSGRLGDPGSSKFFVSFEDSLMRLFSSPRMTALLQRFRPPEGEPISAKVLNKSIETAQKRVEQRNYTIRKHTLEYDDVMNKQRKEVYAFRNELLFADNAIQLAEDLVDSVVSQMGEPFLAKESNWNPNGYAKALMTHFPVSFEESEFDNDYSNAQDIEKKAKEKILAQLHQKLFFQRQLLSSFRPDLTDAEKAQGVLQEVIRNLMIRKIDQLWQEHLLHIDHLRSDVHMRTVGQKDPLLEFKHESFSLFESFSTRLRQEISRDRFRFEMMPQTPQQRLQQTLAQLQRQQNAQPNLIPKQELNLIPKQESSAP
jgi:preprotein translocase subunit SecA